MEETAVGSVRGFVSVSAMGIIRLVQALSNVFLILVDGYSLDKHQTLPLMALLFARNMRL